MFSADYTSKGITKTKRRELQTENYVGPNHQKLQPVTIVHCFAEAKAVSGSYVYVYVEQLIICRLISLYYTSRADEIDVIPTTE